jgi:hypothetical protein
MHSRTSELPPKDMELSDEQKQYLREALVGPGLLHELDLPLHQAAYEGDNVQLSSLLTPNININTRSINDFTALRRRRHSVTGRTRTGLPDLSRCHQQRCVARCSTRPWRAARFQRPSAGQCSVYGGIAQPRGLHERYIGKAGAG